MSEVNKGSIVAFSIEPKTGSLTQLNSQSAGGSGPCHLVVDKTGKAVLAANYGSGSCTSIPIKADGSLGEPASVFQHKGMSILPNQKGPHAHSINLDKANKFAFCCDLGLDKVLVYRFDPETGKLTPNDPPAFETPAGSGPRHFAFHPNGKTAYINGEMSMTVIVCDYDADKGVLTKKQIISTIPDGEKKKQFSTAEVVVHPSGKFVYVSNRDAYNSIAIFTVDPKTGELTAAGHEARRHQDAAELRHRSDGAIHAGGESERQERDLVPYRSEDGSVDADRLERGSDVAGVRAIHTVDDQVKGKK